LISADVGVRVAHYRLLDTTCAYVRQKLNEAGESERSALRHADYFRSLFDRTETGAVNRSATDWPTIHAGLVDNVRAALDWAFSPHGNVAVGVALTISTVPLWLNLSLMDECRKRVKRALSYLSSAAGTTPRQEMQLLTALGVASIRSALAPKPGRYGSG
jgi:predicted ATPase